MQQVSNEQWKPIKGYEGIYEISDNGRVRSVERVCTYLTGQQHTIRGKFLRPFPDKQGYQLIGLHFEGKVRNRLIHRLVAEAFIPNPENKPQVDHIDTDKNNNHVSNLRWVTESENQRNELSRFHNSTAKYGINRGKENPLSKPVIQYSLSGEIIRVWDSQQDIVRELGYSNADISRCCNNIRHTAHGFIWRFKNNASTF